MKEEFEHKGNLIMIFQMLIRVSISAAMVSVLGARSLAQVPFRGIAA